MTDIELYMQRLNDEIPCLPRGFWCKDSTKRVVKYLLEDYLKYDREQILENFCVKFIRKYKLEGCINHYNNSPYELLNAVYPNEYKPWELKNTPVNTWSEEKAVEAMKWLFKEKLKWSREDILQNYSKKTFIENGLKSILYLYNQSPYEVLDATYPGEYKPWELRNVPLKTWNDQNAAEATKWLFETHLKWSEEEIKLYATRRVFKTNGLTGLMKCYTSVYELLELAYPGKYKETDLRHQTKK